MSVYWGRRVTKISAYRIGYYHFIDRKSVTYDQRMMVKNFTRYCIRYQAKTLSVLACNFFKFYYISVMNSQSTVFGNFCEFLRRFVLLLPFVLMRPRMGSFMCNHLHSLVVVFRLLSSSYLQVFFFTN